MKIINEKGLALYAGSGTPADKEGFLLKKGEVNKGFQKRWFVLKGNLLFYYERKGDREPIGMIALEGCTIELDENSDNFTFQIVFAPSGCRTYIISAESQEEMESWMKALSCAGYDYVRLMVSELQNQLHDLSVNENAASICQEADRNTRVYSSVYQPSPSDGKRTIPRKYHSEKRTNPFNSMKSIELDWETDNDINNATGHEGSFSPGDSTGDSPRLPRTFLEMHAEVSEQYQVLSEEWKKKKGSL